MLGAIIGDVVGSRFEFNNKKPILGQKTRPTRVRIGLIWSE